MSHDVHTIVVGAGVIGLAIARQLSSSNSGPGGTDSKDVLLIEAQPGFGSETSARNSEVIHAGIYYPRNSLKAALCVRGKALLYDYCEKHGVPFKRLGKIIVAINDEQMGQLDEIALKARNNGVDDLQLLNEKEITTLEPQIKAKAGLLSPSTGIVDSHGYMLSLLGAAEAHGTTTVYNSTVTNVSTTADGFNVHVSGGNELTLSCKQLINASGHGAIPLAKNISGLSSQHSPTAHFAKGNYFRLQGSAPVSRLIYPIPEPGGLGVHITVDMAGQCRFGPDVQWQDNLDYSVDADRADAFYSAIRQYWPALQDNTLQPDYAGIRPKIKLHGEWHNDFLIQGREQHGINGLVNLFGMESPGLTASLAIAEHVQNLLHAH